MFMSPDLTPEEQIRPPTGVMHPTARVQSDAPEISLEGPWRFRYDATGQVLSSPDDPGSDWPTIPVPGHWQLEGHGSPAYTNIQYPFPIDPPHVPESNPTGEYRREILVPEGWPDGRRVLRFDGVDSWFAVWLNGVFLGDSSGSRLTTEFDVTDKLHVGANLLAVRVRQWSFASYIEGQDQWWLSGIFRSVTLRCRPEGGIHDVVVAADWDAELAQASLRVDVEAHGDVEVRMPKLGRDIPVAEIARLEGVAPWTPETPITYELVVSTQAETVRLRVGFRRVSIDNGVLRLNGAPLVFRGVNRHDFSPRRGRAVTREDLLADVLAMKAHHINAVRTSHYPPSPDFLDLCDEYGLAVVEECDVETHGFSLVDWVGNPSDDPAWRDVYVDRMERMVARDRNHPSVVMWSLGNEAGWGENLTAMAEWTRATDATRPIHYEQDADTRVVDVYSRMYPTPAELAEIATGTEPAASTPELDARRRSMPMIMCEYAHAMGAGPGALKEYQDIVDSSPRLAGGFVWEWFDHGLEVSLPDGGTGWRYGGDFGEEVHDGSYIIDGLVLPDRTPSPGLRELAAVFAPIRLSLTDDGARVRVRNGRLWADTSDLRIVWRTEIEGHVADSGELSAAPIEAGEEVVLDLPRIDSAATLTISAESQSDTPWAPAGAVHGVIQRIARPASPTVTPLVPVTLDAHGVRVGPAKFDARGRLRALLGHEVAWSGLSAWRAPTENDRYAGLGEDRPRLDRWREQGLDRLQRRLVGYETDGNALIVRCRYAAAGRRAGFLVTERWTSDGDTARLEWHVVRDGDSNEILPRLDFALDLPEYDPLATSVRWRGLGPGESYPDSRESTLHGTYTSTVEGMQTPYTVPQENGCRLDTSWAELSLTAGALRIVCAQPGTFTVRPWSDRVLEMSAHADALRPDGLLRIRWGAGIDGLGSATCGPAPAEYATLRLPEARLDLVFSDPSTLRA